MKNQPFVRERRELARSRFLALTEVHFTDERGRERRWDATERVSSQGAVVIIATLQPDGRRILVRQFRPPAGLALVEFPAGLIDPGEDAATAAHRELWEETGYAGTIVRIHPPAFNSPGLSGETVTLVEMHVDAAAYPEPPENHQEDTEHIETMLLAPAEFDAFAAAAAAAGWALDAKVLSHFLLRS